MTLTCTADRNTSWIQASSLFARLHLEQPDRGVDEPPVIHQSIPIRETSKQPVTGPSVPGQIPEVRGAS